MKNKHLGNYQKLSPETHQAIANLYKTAQYTTEQIAKNYNISTRQVQRIAKKLGVVRTQAEANRVIAPLKNYHRIPKELRVKRKQLTNRVRYDLISLQPYCTLCGSKPEHGIRLEVDHIDNNPSNNTNDNLQVLCNICNRGKYHSSKNFQ